MSISDTSLCCFVGEELGVWGGVLGEEEDCAEYWPASSWSSDTFTSDVAIALDVQVLIL